MCVFIYESAEERQSGRGGGGEKENKESKQGEESRKLWRDTY